MENKTILIKGGQIVTSKETKQADVLISDQKIIDVAPSIQVSHDYLINANNHFILPGIIDPQVHFREPGLTHKEDISTGSMAAASGGVTTFFEMPNTMPTTTTKKTLNQKYEIAKKNSLVNYNFFFGATKDNIEEIKSLKECCGLKIFMGSSTGSLLVNEDEALDRIFSVCNKVIAVHAEDEDILNQSAHYAKGTDFNMHLKARPVEAAVTATKKAIKLALKYKKRLHVLHVSTAEEVDMIRQHKPTQLITAETTPQHLLLEAPHIYNEMGAFAQMNPPIREKYHQDALWEGLFDGTINCIATDHAPHTLSEKKLPYGQAPSGMPGVETSLTLMLNEVSNQKATINNIVQWMCENPVKAYKIKNKGFVKPGFDADLTIVDMNKKKTILNDNMKTKCGWSAFHGVETTGWPITTIVLGHIVYDNEKLNLDIRGKKVKLDS